MVGCILRTFCGFLVACLAAGVVQVCFVTAPAEVLTEAGGLSAEKLGPLFMLALLVATHAAIFAAPFALVLIWLAEWNAIRSWVYYAAAGVFVGLCGFLAQYATEVSGQPTIVNNYALKAYLTTGFFAGFVYWLVAGRFGPETPSWATSERTASAPQPAAKPPAADSEPPTTAEPSTA